jgi:hypothetical protein
MTKTKIDYSKACIYKIVCKDIDIKDCYVGSTTNLTKRRYHHKFNCNNENSNGYNLYVYRFIREHRGYNNWEIIEIEKLNDCEDKESLLRRERFHLENLGATLNKEIPGRTDKEYRQDNKEKIAKYNKEYQEINKEKIAKRMKEYRQDNKEKIKEYQEINKEKIAKYKKEYEEINKEKIKEKRKEKMTCECGSIFRKSDKHQHYKSKKHQNYLKTIEI